MMTEKIKEVGVATDNNKMYVLNVATWSKKRKLYVEGAYRLYPSTTTNIENARRFGSYEEAAKYAKRFGAEIIEIEVSEEEANN